MSTRSKLSDIGSSITGNVKKAVLIFGTGGASSSGNPSGGGASLPRMTQEKLNQTGLTNTSLLSTAGTRHIEVQYNPSSIQLSANADSVQMRNLQNSLEDGVINQRSRAPSVMMTVDLIFNAVNIKDSFMADKFRVSANDIVTNVASLVNAGSYTVQPQSNGLLAATFSESDRFVTFQWADLSFSGELTDVSVKYGMFSLSGKPVHSVVTLRILQQLAGSAEDTKWNQSKFDECFSGGQSKSIGQSVGNLLNITGF